MPTGTGRTAAPDAAALVALVRAGRRPASHYADLVEETGSAPGLLDDELGLLASELASEAAADLVRWEEQGVRLLTVLDPDYPQNLRAVHDRPPFIFVRGRLHPEDEQAVAVIGSRRASAAGIAQARATSEALIASGYTIVSGLAAGIDTAAHMTALERDGRTIAVLGTGLNRCYPPQNAALQRQIASDGAVVSQFWPDDGPGRDTFPQRNALMSGMALATIIVEATITSGARIQARQALGHGRPVLLVSSLLEQPWAKQLAERPGVHIIASPEEAVNVVERLSSFEAPVG